ncbi:MAG: ribosome-recycling factor [Candidatus Liptonbacteria bacterium]|nr:ribosome-recycling factor [Candidatus Liptonbacteria bacterium]MBI3114636.1 ribosome-recycling factor [Candidatus Harrisonbacteria bacterium]
MDIESFLKSFEQSLKSVLDKLREALRFIHSNRPSVDLVGDLKVNCYDQWFTVKQLGAITMLPPRGIQVTVWDKGAVGSVTKAIEDARMGLTASAEGLTVRATLSALSNERREELAKTVKREAEESRIRVRAARDEANKKLKAAEVEKKISEDVLFKAKEKLQKIVDEANERVESALAAKIVELQE